MPFSVRLRNALSWLLLLLALLLFVCGSLAAAGRYWLLPQLPAFKTKIEAQASKALGVPLVIDSLSADWRGWQPVLQARGVSVGLAPVPALKLSEVSGVLSWQSLLRGIPVFDRLDLGGPEVRIRRDRTGKFVIADIVIDPKAAGASDGVSADWLVAQGIINISGATLEWNDELRGAAPALLRNAQVRVTNKGLRHSLVLSGELQAASMAQTANLLFKGNFSHGLLTSASDFSRYRGEMYVQIDNAGLAAVRSYVDLPFDIRAGLGNARLWLGVANGKLTQAVADVALLNFGARLAKGAEPLLLQRLQGRISAQLDVPGIELNAEQLVWQLQNPVERKTLAQVEPLDIALRYNGDDPKLAGGQFSASALDLGELQQLSQYILLPDGVRTGLKKHDPQGRLQQVSARWKGAIDAPVEYAVQAAFTQLSLDAVEAPPLPLVMQAPNASALNPGVPGFRGVSGSFKATHRDGSAQLSIDNGALSLPGVLEPASVDLDKLNARLTWNKQQTWHVDVDVPEFASAHGAGRAKAAWVQSAFNQKLGRPGPGTLDLKAAFTRMDAKQAWRYLPISIHEPVRDYLRAAIVQGESRDMTIAIKGDLYNFPFADNSGEFRIAAKFDNGGLDYMPASVGFTPWPAMSNMKGQLLFDKASMRVVDLSAKINGVTLTGVSGGIADMRHDSVLTLSGATQGPLDDYIKYVQLTPINGWTGKALGAARGSGNAKLDLKLSLPLAAAAKTRVEGKLALAGNDFVLSSAVPAFTRAVGAASFDERGFNIKPMKAQFLGGEVSLEGGTQTGGANAGSVAFTLAGSLTSDALKREPALKGVSAITQRLNGQARYDGTVLLRSGVPELSFSSSLQGMALDFPAPVGKPADSALPFKYANALQPAAAGDAPENLRDELSMQIGPAVQVRYERQLKAQPSGSAGGNTSMQVQRGVIAVNNPATLPDAGVFAHVSMPRVSVDAWANAFSGKDAGGSASGNSADAAGESYKPNLVVFQAEELITQRKQLRNVVVGASFLDGQWQANLEAQDVSGYVAWRPSQSGGLGRVSARLSKFIVPPDSREVDALFEGSPEQLPAVDVVIEDFQFKGKKWGRVELDAVNRNVQGVREWRLNRLTLTNPESAFVASGNWVPVNAQAASSAAAAVRRTALTFKLDIGDAGGLLTRFGIPGAMRGGVGKLEGNVAWVGQPYAFDYPSLSGKFDLSLGKGQFLKVDPGAAKLLSVLSLQTLPRRMLLDFSDVFSQGFAFDEVTGEVKIDSGVANTNNLKMRGSQATVLMEGNADIARETTKLFVVVEPDINLGTASLAYAAINPAIGLTTFLLQWIARKPINRALTQQFEVSGSWYDPKVEKVDRTANAAVPVSSN